MYGNSKDVTFQEYINNMTNGTEYGNEFAFTSLCFCYIIYKLEQDTLTQIQCILLAWIQQTM